MLLYRKIIQIQRIGRNKKMIPIQGIDKNTGTRYSFEK